MPNTSNTDSTIASDNSAPVWTQDKSISLAELWEAEPVLWDKNHAGYKSGTAKFDALKRIADELHTTPNIVQSKLSNIRSQLSREQSKLKKKQTGSGASEKPRTTWFLFDYLTFLTGSTRIRNTISSTNSEAALVEEVPFDEDSLMQSRFDATYDIADLPDPGSTGSEETLRGECSTLPKRRAVNAALTDAVVALSKSLAEPEKPGVVQKEDDECDIFGKLIAKRMRTIKSGVIRMLAEQEVLNVVTTKICEDEGVTLTSISQGVG